MIGSQTLNRVAASGMAAGLLLAGFAVSGPGVARADSCWDHNGSLMRLVASGNRRWLYYEVPKASIRKSGVKRGTLLFDGRKEGDYYIGTARRFSRYCPDDPLEYAVEGPVRGDQLKVTLFGTYEVHKKCRPTGRMREDRLVFTYKKKC